MSVSYAALYAACRVYLAVFLQYFERSLLLHLVITLKSLLR